MDKLLERTVELCYPYIVIDEPNQTLPLLVTDLEDGTIPIIVEMNGKKKVVKRITPSAYNINWLIRTTSVLTYYKSADDFVKIDSVSTYLKECA